MSRNVQTGKEGQYRIAFEFLSRQSVQQSKSKDKAGWLGNERDKKSKISVNKF